TGSARLGTISIAGQVVTVVQDAGLGEDCGFGIAPSFESFTADGGAGSLNVFADARCAWQAVSNASWISVTSASVGIGNATVSYSVAPNGSLFGRKGAITIAGHTFSIKQTGSQ
ncbi:MAG TPA: BACON domain-containing protein, partial [Blastocatellia bacterium]|nr:BACON domain-containing protein [Blastocatellia bacterium]